MMRINAVIRRLLVISWAHACWAADKKAEAVVIQPSQYFEGNDGPWSTFFVRVGKPEQAVRVLPSTAAPETIVVLPEGCSDQAFDTVPDDCAVSRGVLFDPDKSSTYELLGTFGINNPEEKVGLEYNLGYSQAAKFFLETLGAGLVGPTLKEQTVAGVGTADHFYLGIFGLNNQPINYTDLGNSKSGTFITSLKDEGIIPSLSWSYTAGAKYRLKQVYGQLIFSGYDTSRFDENQATFTLAGDYTRDIVVSLQSIRFSGESQKTLLDESILIMIDSTDANLWLPESACEAFEEAFGLTLDDKTGLYLVDDALHASLVDSNPEVTFTLSDVEDGGQTVTISLPYSAFDLTAGPPLVDGSSRYFPLKKADNETQYTLGRTFLQEAYLSVDYERGVFNVSSCRWVQGEESNIVTILSKDDDPDGDGTPGGSGSGDSSSASSSTLGGGAIGGIVAGTVIFLALIGFAVFCIKRRRKRSRFRPTSLDPNEAGFNGDVFNAGYPSPYGTEPTIPGSSVQGSQGHLAPAPPPSSSVGDNNNNGHNSYNSTGGGGDHTMVSPIAARDTSGATSGSSPGRTGPSPESGGTNTTTTTTTGSSGAPLLGSYATNTTSELDGRDTEVQELDGTEIGRQRPTAHRDGSTPFCEIGPGELGSISEK